MKISELRAEFATTIFFRECMRQYIKLYPGKYAAGDMPVRALVDYPPAHQRAMIEAIKKAVEAADGMDELFVNFVTEKQALATMNGQPFNMQG